MYHDVVKKTIFLGLLAGLVTLLIARLVDVQLVHGRRFLQLADENRLFSLSVPPTRGVFLDRYGESLVWNTRSYHKKEQPFSLYSKTTPIDDAQGLQLLATAGAEIERKISREYPYGEVLAHTLGYIGPVTAEDVAKDDSLLPSQYIGKIGLEAFFNQQVQGLPGTEVWEINARVSRQRKVSEEPAQEGETIQTSFDPYLSQVAASALAGKKGSVVIADAMTGKLLSLVSSPSFNPNLFVITNEDEQQKQLRQKTIQELFASPDKPFFNRTISGAYPPGSIFKLVTALAGLEAKAFNSSTTVLDEGVLKVGEYEYGNWYYRQYGRTDGQVGLVRALAHSNDIFFYKAAEWTGVNQLATMAQLLGLGRKTGVEITPESAGLIPTPSWKETVIGEQWYLGNTYHMGIGQGDLLVTPVQIAQMVQTIANRGQQCQLSLLQKNPPECHSLSLQEVNIELVLEGMLDACSPDGTAFPFYPRNDALRTDGSSAEESLSAGAVACKTGTAEFGGANEKGYRNTHGWWVGIVEPKIKLEDTPVATESAAVRQKWLAGVQQQGFPKRLVIVVLVESDEQVPFREGSRDASPIGKTILDWIEG